MNIQPVSFTSRYKSAYKSPEARKPNIDKKAFDETLLRINSDTTNPCSYYIQSYQHKIPQTIENTYALEDFYNGRLNHDEFLAQVSFNNICNNIFSKYDVQSSAAQKARIIEQSLLDGDEDASTYEMVLDSIKDKELNCNTLFGLDSKAWFKDDFLEDLNKYYEAKANNLDIESVFVPKFKAETDALNLTPRGGVFQIEDKENIFIKTDENEAEELFITPKTYLELFPPLERNALCQGEAGDCFFISSIQALYSNPISRHFVLEMFKENPDGSLSVSLSGYKKEDGKVVLKDKDAYEIKDAADDMKIYNKESKKRLAFQYEAMRLLEMCIDKTTKFDAYNKIKDQYDLYCSALEFLKDDDDFIELEDGLKYTKKEMELFIKLIGDINDSKRVTDEIISLKDSFINSNFESYFFDEDAIIDTTMASLEDLDYTQDEQDYLLCVLNRYKQYFKDNPDKKIIDLNDFLTKNCYMAINGTEEEFDYVIKGGSPERVFKRLGLKAKKLEEDEIKEFFKSPDLNSNYAITATASKRYNDPYIIPAHAYSIRADKIGQKDIICAQNPYSSNNDILMTPETAGEVFDDVFVAEI